MQQPQPQQPPQQLKLKPHKVNNIKKVKYCHCGHLINQHEYDGCTAIIEGTECEDHWPCRCMDIQAIHINMYRKESRARRKKNREQA